MTGRSSHRPALRRFAVTLEYDGASYGGWQFQENAPTVQAALERAIERLFRERRRVGGASRTDAGVHALGQVAVFDLAHSLPPARLAAALNSVLPASVRVLDARPVAADWDPRTASLRKTYRYLIHDREVPSPLWSGRAWQVRRRLDLPAMRRAARVLVGRHDFSAFRAAGCEADHPVRTVRALSLARRGDLISIRVTADAFLYHMVRNLVGTLAEVGKGRMTPAQVGRVLRALDRRQAGPTAPAEGLYLERVEFGRPGPRHIAGPERAGA
jgi:tRNA pseudouridine38-40 synthase